jgi:hypothetical protein
MKKLLSSIAFAVFAFLSLSAEGCGETHLIDDSGFDIWCGDRLCSWELESGSVARAPTWHKDDYSVDLIGSDVVISQLSTGSTTSCIRFELLADIEDDARVTLTMDFFDDGVVDYTQELAHVRWESLAYFVSTPASWQGVRFTLHKEGPGRARLAQIEATADTSCIDKPIEIASKPMGASCTSGAECSSQVCADSVEDSWVQVCSGCSTSEECGEGMVCGAASENRSYLGATRTCIPEASRPVGAMCVGDAECRVGFCREGLCQECRSASDCEQGEECTKPNHNDLSVPRVAALCSGGDAGTLCMRDVDCDSGRCLGGDSVKVCNLDGRDCIGDSDCPYNWLVETPSCVIAGFDPGTCQ